MAERENNLENIEKQKTKKSSKRKNSLGRELLEDVVLVIVVLAVVFFLKNYVLINAVIPSGSMENTIMTGDRVFGNRLAYRFGEPERGDIVIFKYPDNEEELYIKRVIGLPGDKVEIRDGLVYLNDSAKPLEEPYLKETPVGDYDPYQVPEDGYFMLGDNRNWSKDSRFWENTYVTREEVLAKAVFRYYPFDEIGTIE
ncbi:MAG: signal peptidase I [Ruminococcus sp.]